MRDYVILDVFTDTPLEGNPVAVFTDAEGLSPELMQRAARELNLSETVFLLSSDRDADARVRIFTPASELPFAGHPVLGSAFVLGERLGAETVRLRTGMGVITVALERDANRITAGEMEQPIPRWEVFEHRTELLGALGVQPTSLPIEVYDNGPRHVFVELGTDHDVAAVRPDLGALAELGAVGVSTFAATGTRVRTRMFAPGLGVAEDPATGSAAGPLAVHLCRHGRVGFGQPIEVRQGAEIGRPSLLRAVAEGSEDRVQRVAVGGGAVLVARGQYRLD